MTRSITITLVGWCPDCKVHYGPYGGPGITCMMEECERKLVKRRRWVCSVCECSYSLKTDAENHECHECD